MRVSQRALAAMMVVNVAAALGVYVLSRAEHGLSGSVLYSRFRDLEQNRVIAVNEEAMRAHYLSEISQGDAQTSVPEFLIEAQGRGSLAAGVAVGLLVVNAVVMWVWLLCAPVGTGDRCAQSWADEESSSKKDAHPGPLP